MPIVYVTIDFGTVSAGDSESDTWKAERDYTLHKIIAVEKSGTSLYNVVLTFRDTREQYTKAYIPLSYLQGYDNQVPEWNLPVPEGETLTFSVENKSTSDVNLYLVLKLEYTE